MLKDPNTDTIGCRSLRTKLLDYTNKFYKLSIKHMSRRDEDPSGFLISIGAIVKTSKTEISYGQVGKNMIDLLRF